MILFSAPSETENYNNQVNVKAYREFDVEKGKKNNNEKKYIYLRYRKSKRPTVLSLKCNVDDGSYEVRVSREKMYILYK